MWNFHVSDTYWIREYLHSGSLLIEKMICKRPTLSLFQQGWVLRSSLHPGEGCGLLLKTPEPSLSAGSAGQGRDGELQICDFSLGPQCPQQRCVPSDRDCLYKDSGCIIIFIHSHSPLYQPHVCPLIPPSTNGIVNGAHLMLAELNLFIKYGYVCVHTCAHVHIHAEFSHWYSV